MKNLWPFHGTDDQIVRPNRHAQNSSTTHAGCPIAQSRPSNRMLNPSRIVRPSVAGSRCGFLSIAVLLRKIGLTTRRRSIGLVFSLLLGFEGILVL